MIIKRKRYLDQIKNAFGSVPIVILIGARQVGKTTLMNSYEIHGSCMKVHGQDATEAELFSKLPLIRQHLSMNFGPQLEGTLLIDEFQYIPGIDTMLKLLADKFPLLKILCTGSSSLDILNKMKESMAGRVRYIPVYSLSFTEFLLFTDPELLKNFDILTPDDDLRLLDPRIPFLMNEYLVYGGLPKVALTNDPSEKVNLLTDIMRSYLLHDVRNFIRNEDFIKFNKVLRLLASQIGGMVNISEISRTTGLSYTRCEEYVHILEQMYILNMVAPYTTNKRNEITRMRKVYFFDPGIRNILQNDFNGIETRIDNGALFENFVFQELIKEVIRPESIRYYRTRDGMKIDFILEKGGSVFPIEVKFRNYKKPPSDRGIKSFDNIKTYRKAWFINRNCNTTQGKIHYLPGYYVSKINI